MYLGSSKTDMWLMANAKYFSPEHMPTIKGYLDQLPADRELALFSLDLKEPFFVLVISIFFGEFGIDRFVIGDTGLGVAKLLTLGGCGIWWIVDMFLIMGRTRDKNFEKFMQGVVGYY